MSPKGREQRTKIGIYHSLSGVGSGAERIPPEVKEFQRWLNLWSSRHASDAGTEGDSVLKDRRWG